MSRISAIPIPPKATLDEYVAKQEEFLETKLQPDLAQAQEGKCTVYFVDTAHFVRGVYLCCAWCLVRMMIRGASGRKRHNVLGAWNATTGELVLSNTTLVSSDTMLELLANLRATTSGPMSLVLDNARYQHCDRVMAEARRWGIDLQFLPGVVANPHGANENNRHPAMICLPESSTWGKEIPIGHTTKGDQVYAHELAERGYVCLVLDYPPLHTSEYKNDPYAMKYDSATMKGIVNHRRGVDLLQSLPYVDGDSVGVIGHSLGGHLRIGEIEHPQEAIEFVSAHLRVDCAAFCVRILQAERRGADLLVEVAAHVQQRITPRFHV